MPGTRRSQIGFGDAFAKKRLWSIIPPLICVGCTALTFSAMKPPLRARSAFRRFAFIVATAAVLCGLRAYGDATANPQTTPPADDTRQEHIHHMGGHVMPFQLGKTQHVFEMTETGGVMQVIARDPKDADQIRMIQHHLEHEAGLFQKGDFSDPARLHGKQMPGLSDLAAAGAKLHVRYSTMSDGAQVSFRSNDIHVITAVHRWFGAQLSDHGADATSK
jgi:hypothetical protein